MVSNASKEAPRYRNRIAISLLAALPFALLQLAFIADPYGWSVALFGYAGIIVIGIVVFFAWLVYLAIEVAWRSRLPSKSAPYFALAGCIFLLFFFVPSIIVQPILQQMPSFCRATQTVRWNMSNDEKFILALAGTGNVDDYRFVSGYFDWTGDGRAGFSSVHINPIEFQFNYYESHHPGSIELLGERMAASNIPSAELESAVRDVWNVLKLADRGEPVSSKLATVEPVWSHVDNSWDSIIGGCVWLILLSIAFVAVGPMTIPRSNIERVV